MRLRRLTELDPNLAHVVRALGLSALMTTGCVASDGPSAGAEGGPCLDNDCLGTLQCNEDNVCVSVDGGSSGMGSAGGATPDDDDDGDGDSGESETGAGGKAGDSDSATCFDGQGDPVEGNTPPEIVQLDVDGTAITSEQDGVRITMTVSDADGLDDIADVRFEAPGGRRIKTLTQSSSDTFTAEIDWEYDISYAEEELLGLEVDFRAVVTDQGCNATEATVTLLLCERGESQCSGTCTETQSNDQNCGTCGNACADTEYCSYGRCEEDYGYDYDYDYAQQPEPTPALQSIEATVEPISLSFSESASPDSAAKLDAFSL